MVGRLAVLVTQNYYLECKTLTGSGDYVPRTRFRPDGADFGRERSSVDDIAGAFREENLSVAGAV